MNHGKKALGKITTIEPGLFLGLNYLLLHSDRHRPAIQEHDQREVTYQRSLWNGLCSASLVTHSSFYLWRPKQVSAKKSSLSSFLTQQTLRHSKVVSKRLPEKAISSHYPCSFYHIPGLSEVKSHRSKILSPEELLHFLPALRTPSGSELASEFNKRKLQSRDDVLLTKATPPTRLVLGEEMTIWPQPFVFPFPLYYHPSTEQDS